jgi:hypothetical protein
MTDRGMRLGLSIRGHGYHPAAWRHPDVPADATLHVEHYVRSAQIAERGKLDMIFFADGAGIRQGDNPLAGLGSLFSTFGDLSGYPLDGQVPATLWQSGSSQHQRATHRASPARKFDYSSVIPACRSYRFLEHRNARRHR